MYALAPMGKKEERAPLAPMEPAHRALRFPLAQICFTLIELLIAVARNCNSPSAQQDAGHTSNRRTVR
jgi:hypothetical protein